MYALKKKTIFFFETRFKQKNLRYDSPDVMLQIMEILMTTASCHNEWKTPVLQV
jgi:hypothetical protein